MKSGNLIFDSHYLLVDQRKETFYDLRKTETNAEGDRIEWYFKAQVNGTDICVGDCVLLESGTSDPFIAVVGGLCRKKPKQSAEAKSLVSCLWCFRDKELPAEVRLPEEVLANEVFPSINDTDCNLLSTFKLKVKLVPYRTRPQKDTRNSDTFVFRFFLDKDGSLQACNQLHVVGTGKEARLLPIRSTMGQTPNLSNISIKRSEPIQHSFDEEPLPKEINEQTKEQSWSNSKRDVEGTAPNKIITGDSWETADTLNKESTSNWESTQEPAPSNELENSSDHIDNSTCFGADNNSSTLGSGLTGRRGRIVECYYCHEEGHTKNECPKKFSRVRECYKCGQTGHISRDCTNQGRHRIHDNSAFNSLQSWGSSDRSDNYSNDGGNPARISPKSAV